jgi:acyl-CoA synthetase (AMP-forming)/AMP-acid ligase II
VHDLTLGDVARENRRTHASRLAIVCGTDRYTYRQLDERVDRLAGSLQAAGVEKGGRVLWMGQNCHRLLELVLAVAKRGASVCPLNWRQSADECAFIIDDLQPAVIVWQDEAIGPVVRQARSMSTSESRWIQHDAGPHDGYEAFLDQGPAVDPAVQVDPMSAVVIMYTAAFEGRPSGSMLTHTGLLTQNANLFKLVDMWPGFVYLNCGPPFHIGTLRHTLATFHIGGTNVFAPRADPQQVMELIAGEKCVTGMVLPPTITKILELNRNHEYDLTRFRSAMRMDGWNDMVHIDGSPSGRAIGGYGQTELHGLDIYAAYGGREGITTAGTPSPFTRVRIVDERGNEVPDGESGEMVFYGPLVHQGYWNRPQINAYRTRTGGWHSGDLGRRDHDGVIYFIGPLAPMIKSGVENIYPPRSRPASSGCPVYSKPQSSASPMTSSSSR